MATAMAPKTVLVVALTIVAVALVGLVVGLGSARPFWSPPPLARLDPGPTTALPAARYLEMDGKTRGPNRGYASALSTLAPSATIPSEMPVQTDEQRQDALARRASRRAYHGAPPTIPHPVDSNDVTSCFVCHGQGQMIGSVIAPRISHERFTNCTQCHAQAATVTPGAVPDFAVANDFVGLASPTRGERAYAGAPPTIPHQTSMRENCMSCHGPLGLAGMRTPHPWRVNCQQCHAPSATLDQHHATEPGPPPWAGER